jgi:hypothetical protein
MPSPHLLLLEPHGFEHAPVVMFGVLGTHGSGPTLLVHWPTLLGHLVRLDDDPGRVVFVQGSSPDATTIATIEAMLIAMGSKDGLVRFEMAADAIKLTRSPQVDGVAPQLPVLIERGVDRSTVVSFRPPEILRTSALLAALGLSPSDEWVNPAGLIVANGGRIETYPRIPHLPPHPLRG